MKQIIPITNLSKDKALIFAKKYESLKSKLAVIDASLDEYNIVFDDIVTNKEDVWDVINDIFEINI